MVDENTIMPDYFNKSVESIAFDRGYLRVFDSSEGSREVVLDKKIFVLGRGEDTNLRFPSKTISRKHCVVSYRNNQFFVEDCQSLVGTVLNGKKIARSALKHGDTIMLADFVVQFRTDERKGNKSDNVQSASAAGAYNADKFCFLPSSMGVKYRFISCRPQDIFAPGDTLPIGNGGTIIQTKDEAPKNSCVELELAWPDGKKKKLLSEVINQANAGKYKHIFLKIHDIERKEYESIIENSLRANWKEAVPVD